MKTFLNILKVLCVHILMCFIPLFLSPVLNPDPKYTVAMPKSGGQIIGYAIYFIIFFVVYFLAGRIIFKNNKSLLAPGISGAIIAFVGIFVYFYVIVSQRIELSFLSFFAMPQLMVRRAITDAVIGNKIFALICMILPVITLFAGVLSNKVKRK